jgi:hypothetical protein
MALEVELELVVNAKEVNKDRLIVVAYIVNMRVPKG